MYLSPSGFSAQYLPRCPLLFLVHQAQAAALRPAFWLRNETLRACGDDCCFRFAWLRSVFFFGRNNRRNESIPSSGHSLDKPRGFRVVLKSPADFADCTPDAVIRVEENIIAPYPGHDFVAIDDLSPVLQQQNKDFQWDT